MAPILRRIDCEDFGEDLDAVRRAWSAVMDGTSAALATPGLPSSERSDLLEILTCAAEIAGRQNELRLSLAASDS